MSAPTPDRADNGDGLDLDAIEARAAGATPGPWWKDGWCVFSPPPEDWSGPHAILDAMQRNDADFIAHAREDVPALLAEVRRLRAVVDGVPDMVDRAFDRAAARAFGASPNDPT